MANPIRSPNSGHFAQVPNADIPRSSFDRSHGYKTTFDAGYLIPVFVDEALPGDTFNLNMTGFGRLATPIHPFMDNLYIDSFFFAVPYRLIWDNWQKFNGEQLNPNDSTDYVTPKMTSPAGGYLEHSLSDYLGIPTKIPSLQHTSFWHRAYYLIWNEWFRDQNLQNSLAVPTNDGPDTPGNFVLQRRGKRHDYFTSALPWPQKGPAVQLPLGSQANIMTSSTRLVNGSQQAARFAEANTGNYPAANTAIGVNTFGNLYDSAAAGPAQSQALYPTNLYADLSTATASTINALRQAFQIQRLYERDARGGTRYTEIVRSHFGVTSPDARLQRPEYLGGGSSVVNVNPIAQTSSTDGTSPQGNLAAQGTLHMDRHGFTKSFTEHCILMGMVSVRADLNYQEGLNRMFSRSTRWDFYWPALAHIGEQTVLNKEIYAQGSAAVPTGVDNMVFGYQERYAEYRYKPSVVTGQMRSNATLTLDSWHLAQDFAALPTLSPTLIQEDPPIDRVIAVPTQPHFLFDSYFKLTCARPMPVYSVPGMIDHF